jgi:hypothetical protein
MHVNRVATVLIVVALAAACGGPKPMSLDIPLTIRVTKPLARSLPPVREITPNLKLYIAEVQDQRAEKSKIGENQEEVELGARPVTAGGIDPGRFVRDVFARELPTVGIPTVGAASAANRILTFKLLQFYVIESDTYKAIVDGTVDVTDGSGRILFNGSVTGDDSTFGRSFSAENYEQVLSDASVKVLENLLRYPAFRGALNVQ